MTQIRNRRFSIRTSFNFKVLIQTLADLSENMKFRIRQNQVTFLKSHFCTILQQIQVVILPTLRFDLPYRIPASLTYTVSLTGKSLNNNGSSRICVGE